MKIHQLKECIILMKEGIKRRYDIVAYYEVNSMNTYLN